MEKTLVILDPTLKSGYTNIPNVVLMSPGLSLEAKGLYIILSMFNQSDGVVPDQRKITELTKYSTKTTGKLIRELKQKGYFPVSPAVGRERA
ncbi:Helix-turn-helix domain-containing protein [Desulfotomaculum arcticum]|uniref:Helix-turn-helix domain-containing protein n=1 Tax=Desulfotruncus arcticus DSM 17038 TaxID=1121424 RepID=A0A1I2N3P5_9FIRM|nr:helix-turn-helix domain-containing protein [Desulfotruncus arcticus]SFF97469.1 Helix-turn-helix domain-containing protein [Desulfotomaculum arcticum] [Desulfotruncus arcticus DSM 17038]